MANTVYNRFKAESVRQTVDWLTNAIKVMALDTVNQAAYAVDPDHDFVDEAGAADPVDAEYVGPGYTGGFGGAGRLALASKTVTEDDTNDRAELDAADITWSSIGDSTQEISSVAIIDEQGAADDTTVDLVAFVDSGFPVATNGGDVTVQWNAEGILQLA